MNHSITTLLSSEDTFYYFKKKIEIFSHFDKSFNQIEAEELYWTHTSLYI